MTFPYGQTVTNIRRYVSGADEFGNDVYSYTSEDVAGCVVQPSGSNETVQFTDQVSTSIVVYYPFGTDIVAIDAFMVAGVKYEVEGDPSHWVSPFSGHTAPIEVRGSRVTGVSV